ncbi:hypothetical protein OROMI_034213 [Orobanche minor]
MKELQRRIENRSSSFTSDDGGGFAARRRDFWMEDKIEGSVAPSFDNPYARPQLSDGGDQLLDEGDDQLASTYDVGPRDVEMARDRS